MEHFDLVIIGSGLAGYNLAKEWRKLSQGSLAIISSESADFYSKPQLSTALAVNKSASDLIMKTCEQMQNDLHATIYAHENVINVDSVKKIVKSDNHEVEFKQLVFACGADPINLNLSGNGAGDVLSVNNIQDYAVWREKLEKSKNIAVIGSGLVGCEFTHDLLKSGYNVDVFSIEDYPLARLIPEQLARAFADALQEEGVTWNFNTSVTDVIKQNNKYLLKTNNGTTQEFDLVLSAVGLQPHIKLAQASGLETARGIVTDEYMQTSNESIYALGDCAQVGGAVRLYVAPLLQCAKALAKTLAGDSTRVVFPPMPVTVKTALFPITVLLPPANFAGDWEISGQGRNLRALFINTSGRLSGSVLTGDCTGERMQLINQLGN